MGIQRLHFIWSEEKVLDNRNIKLEVNNRQYK